MDAKGHFLKERTYASTPKTTNPVVATDFEPCRVLRRTAQCTDVREWRGGAEEEILNGGIDLNRVGKGQGKAQATKRW